MQELGELDKHHAEFTKRGFRIIAVSVDDQKQTDGTQERFPHLIVLGDPEQKMTQAFQAIHSGAGRDGSDVAAPTTVLIDGAGNVRWVFRPDRVIVRLSPGELLAAIDEQALAK